MLRVCVGNTIFVQMEIFWRIYEKVGKEEEMFVTEGQ
jgi:hypothetical protein